MSTVYNKELFFMYFSDNVTLQLDGILYYRVEDPYQVKWVLIPFPCLL